MKIGFNPFSLEGKTIHITRASSGIGRSIAITCSKMKATIVVAGRNSSKKIIYKAASIVFIASIASWSPSIGYAD